MAHPEGLEPPTSWSVARRSIQLSYGCSPKIEGGIKSNPEIKIKEKFRFYPEWVLGISAGISTS